MRLGGDGLLPRKHKGNLGLGSRRVMILHADNSFWGIACVYKDSDIV